MKSKIATTPEEPKTKVIFRMLPGKNKECLALFPELLGTCQWWTCLNYARHGQHGHGDAAMIGRPAKPEEYAELKHHLETYLGPDSYRLEVVKRFTDKHRDARKQALRDAGYSAA